MNDSLPSDSDGKQRKVVERYDLTGRTIPKWTENARGKLVATLKRLIGTVIPGSDQTVGDVAEEAPAKVVDHYRAKLEEKPIDNKLKEAQTETEFLKQELLKVQIREAEAKVEAQQIQNARDLIRLQEEKREAIRKQIQEITAGKPPLRIVGPNGNEAVIAADVELPASAQPQPTLDDLELPSSIRALLEVAGIATLPDLVNCCRSKLLKISGIGKARLALVEERLAKLGLQLADTRGVEFADE